MSDNHRKARLNHLIKRDYGNQDNFVKQSGRGKGRVSQMAGEKQPFGEKAAQGLAKDLGLPSDWFNNTWPTPKEAKELGARTNAPAPQPIQPDVADIQGAGDVVVRLGELLGTLDSTDLAMAKIILESLAADPSKAHVLASKLENLLGGGVYQEAERKQKLN